MMNVLYDSIFNFAARLKLCVPLVLPSASSQVTSMTIWTAQRALRC